MQKIKILIVDDSALVRRLLLEILSAEPTFDVVGVASDPYIAREKIKKLNPDVVTLDVEMPRMDGITFLENLMRLHPLPVVMVSSLTQRGAEVTLRSLELGAVDFVAKPKVAAQRTSRSRRNRIGSGLAIPFQLETKSTRRLTPCAVSIPHHLHTARLLSPRPKSS